MVFTEGFRQEDNLNNYQSRVSPVDMKIEIKLNINLLKQKQRHIHTCIATYTQFSKNYVEGPMLKSV